MKSKNLKIVSMVLLNVAILFCIVGVFFLFPTGKKDVLKEVNAYLLQVQNYRMQLTMKDYSVSVDAFLIGNTNTASFYSKSVEEGEVVETKIKYSFDLVDNRMKQEVLLPDETWIQNDYAPQEDFSFDVNNFDMTQILSLIQTSLQEDGKEMEEGKYQVLVSEERKVPLVNPFALLLPENVLEQLQTSEKLLLKIELSEQEKGISTVGVCINQCQEDLFTLQFDRYNTARTNDDIK